MLTLLNIEKQKEYKMTSLSKMASILKRKIGHNIQPQKEILRCASYQNYLKQNQTTMRLKF